MFHSLRARLLVSYVVVILLTLCIAGAGLLVLLQDFQRGIETQRLTDALGPVSIQARAALRQGVPFDTLANEIQDQVDPTWHVLFVDDTGLIIADSQNDFLRRRLPRISGVQNVGRVRFATGHQVLAGRDILFAAAPVGRPDDNKTFLLLATIVRPFLGSLQDLTRPLVTAGAIALAAAVLLALLLARSIAEPLGALTRATEAVAEGKYDHALPVQGDDEAGRLAASFNTMAQAVKRSQQAQKDFVANVSHELKTPLTSIQGFSQAIKEGATRDLATAQHAAGLIFEESQRMARLVGDLLTLARLETGEVPLMQQTLDLTTMLPVWVERFRARAMAEQVTLSLALDAPPTITGDAGRLEQVVANLLDNALKYNRQGGSVQVLARTEMHALGSISPKRPGSKSKPGGEIRCALLRITDTGQGIPAASQERLFERFYRVDTARVAGGSGLGLSIVQEIIRAHHGEIDISSEENVGTTVRVWLPAQFG